MTFAGEVGQEAGPDCGVSPGFQRVPPCATPSKANEVAPTLFCFSFPYKLSPNGTRIRVFGDPVPVFEIVC